MKKYIFTILILLIFFTNAFCQVPDEDGINNMTEEDATKIIIESNEIQTRYDYDFHTLVQVVPYRCITPFNNCWLAIFDWKNSKTDFDYCFECCLIQNETVFKHFDFLPDSNDSDNINLAKFVNLQYNSGIILNQIEKFRLLKTDSFLYDFNHDGIDELLSFSTDGIVNYIHIFTPDLSDFSFCWILKFSYADKTCIEFINYKQRQGVKILDSYNVWHLYRYDYIQKQYIQDKTASSEELEKIHGSPDFFAEAGIDYTKLERPLLPADLEGFSKAALRIWRNAIYVRHGRIFKSEDLQALFNEYAWYTPDENYSDDKLTDTDRANIKLIQEFEEK